MHYGDIAGGSLRFQLQASHALSLEKVAVQKEYDLIHAPKENVLTIIIL
jgi:hypothetical protein